MAKPGVMKILTSTASKIQICAYLCMFSMAAVGQGNGAVVESRGFTPGQVTSQGTASPGAVNNDALALLLEQNQQLQAEVQALRGIIEEQGFELRKLQRDSLARYSNMDERLGNLETAAARGTAAIAPSPATSTSLAAPASTTGINNTASTTGINSTAGTINTTNQNTVAERTPIASTSGAAPVSSTAISSTALPTATAPAPVSPEPARSNGRSTLQPAVLSEQQLYQMAYDSVINSNFERSIAEFDQYLSIYPQGRFLTNAHYWKGQAYLYLNRYDEAREAYEIIIEQHADSPKLPDAMYGLGLAYQGLGNIQQARRLLTDIKRRFPNTGVANLADTRLLSLD